MQKEYINRELVDAYLDFLDLPKEQRYGFANQPCTSKNCIKSKFGCHSHIRMTTAQKAFELQVPLWRRVNPVSNPRTRGNIQEVIEVKNIVFDFEYPPQPLFAVKTAILFLKELIEFNFVPETTAIILSGAGVHIVIPIVPIIMTSPEYAYQINSAINSVKQSDIQQLFERSKELVEEKYHCDLSSMHLECCDIARLLSAPGDWRPSTKETDHALLRNGCLRGVYQNKPLIRIESEKMRTLILTAVGKQTQKDFCVRTQREVENILENGYIELSDYEQVRLSTIFKIKHNQSLAQAIAADCDFFYMRKAKEGTLPLKQDGTLDRSRWFHTLLLILATKSQSPQIIFHFREIINIKSGSKYQVGRELDREAKRSLSYYHGTQTNIRTVQEQQIPFKEIALSLVEFKSDAYITKEQFQLQYKKLCAQLGIQEVSDRKLSPEMQKLGVKVSRIRIQGTVTRVYMGIRLIETAQLVQQHNNQCDISGIYIQDNSGLPSIYPNVSVQQYQKDKQKEIILLHPDTPLAR